MGNTWRPFRTQAQVAEEIQQVQFDRAMERSVLEHAGLEPVPGGELMVSMARAKGRKRRWWQRSFLRLIWRRNAPET